MRWWCDGLRQPSSSRPGSACPCDSQRRASASVRWTPSSSRACRCGHCDHRFPLASSPAGKGPGAGETGYGAVGWIHGPRAAGWGEFLGSPAVRAGCRWRDRVLRHGGNTAASALPATSDTTALVAASSEAMFLGTNNADAFFGIPTRSTPAQLPPIARNPMFNHYDSDHSDGDSSNTA